METKFEVYSVSKVKTKVRVKMMVATFCRRRGKLSSECCPAGRQVLRGEQRQGRGGDQHYNFYNLFLFFLSPFASLCACRSVITPAACDLWVFFLSLYFYLRSHLCFRSLSSTEILLMFPLLPLLPHCCSFPCTCHTYGPTLTAA